METVSVDRTFDADPDRVRSTLADVTPLFEAAGFAVQRDGERLELSKRVAMARIELLVELRDDASAALAYEQVDGPFESMAASYVVEPAAPGSRLAIETSFEPPANGVGSFLNRAAVRRQRRAELDAVASLVAAEADGSPGDADGPS